jgi:hypothetical protein
MRSVTHHHVHIIRVVINDAVPQRGVGVPRTEEACRRVVVVAVADQLRRLAARGRRTEMNAIVYRLQVNSIDNCR